MVPLNEDAIKMKQYLAELKQACMERAGENADIQVREIGTQIMDLLTVNFGDRSNMAAIASLAAALLYVLDETEKRSVKNAMSKGQFVPCVNCQKQPACHDIDLTLEGGHEVYFCSPGCRTQYYEKMKAEEKRLLGRGVI